MLFYCWWREARLKTADKYLHTSLTVLARTLTSPRFPTGLVSSDRQNLFLPQELFNPPARRSAPVARPPFHPTSMHNPKFPPQL